MGKMHFAGQHASLLNHKRNVDGRLAALTRALDAAPAHYQAAIKAAKDETSTLAGQVDEALSGLEAFDDEARALEEACGKAADEKKAVDAAFGALISSGRDLTDKELLVARDRQYVAGWKLESLLRRNAAASAKAAIGTIEEIVRQATRKANEARDVTRGIAASLYGGQSEIDLTLSKKQLRTLVELGHALAAEAETIAEYEHKARQNDNRNALSNPWRTSALVALYGERYVAVMTELQAKADEQQALELRRGIKTSVQAISMAHEATRRAVDAERAERHKEWRAADQKPIPEAPSYAERMAARAKPAPLPAEVPAVPVAEAS